MTLFPLRPEVDPRIYAYEDSNPIYEGLLKIGYTTKSVEVRVAEQYGTKRPGPLPYRIVLNESAMRDDGTSFKDHDVHKFLLEEDVENPRGEWFKCTVDQVRSAVVGVRGRTKNVEKRTKDFQMRPEQENAVLKTIEYYRSFGDDFPARTPKFLWNAKMRFGKTFTAYQLAKRMNFKKVLVLTFKPSVRNAWEDDLKTHIDFSGWQFITKGGLTYEEIDAERPFVCFASFQDFLGRADCGGIKLKNKWAHNIEWDLVILDEYHFGAWRSSAQELFESEDSDEQRFLKGQGLEYFTDDFDQDIIPIRTNYYLYLSGTPFRAISSGEFIEEQIFNWTYQDEQEAKNAWKGENNPYESLPRMVLLTYQMPDSVIDIASEGEYDQFNLNEFFKAEGQEDDAKFVHENEVQKWLDIIRGASPLSNIDNLKLGSAKPPLPFSDTRLLRYLGHTLWFLPDVSSCYAMRNLLKQRQNIFYHDYHVNVAAGRKAGIGAEALKPVEESMRNPLSSKTITLTCGKLTTGVTVRPWAGILMLRNTTAPETYFQAAFRVQSPWVVADDDIPGQFDIIKKECYVFDFAPDRALRLVADYGCNLDVNTTNPEKKIQNFIRFLPILAFDGSTMRKLRAYDILDYAISGTTATLLAKRWESALLVNVDNRTLSRLLDNDRAMEALMSIVGFRNLREDLTLIINKSENVKEMKKEASDRELTKKEKKSLTEEEKEYKSLRRQIQDKLITFSTRIPIFMYLSEFREYCLKDVINKLEPELFMKVTGLSTDDFDLLLSLNLFNEARMNSAVLSFKRYEDSSLEYSGINKRRDSSVGLFSTVISSEEYRSTQ